MISVSFVTQFLSILTLLGDLFIVGFLAFMVFLFVKRVWIRQKLSSGFLANNGLIFAFFIALIATGGSLFYSEIAGYTPCKLCWLQRIFMYPQVILLGTALIKKTKDIAYYIIPMSLIGMGISVYHYFIQRAAYAASCSLDGVSCTSKYIFHFGYITIPIMALTAFGLIIIFTYFWKKK